jgi:hypothetical protein
VASHNGKYDGNHPITRKRLEPVVALGQTPCSRCGQLIRRGQLWDLDHDDARPGFYLGPSHRSCNRRAGAALARARARLKPPEEPVRPTRESHPGLVWRFSEGLGGWAHFSREW